VSPQQAVQAGEKLRAERGRWELVRNSGEDQRIFRRRGDAAGLYLADHSGNNPDETADGPLRIVTPDELIGVMDWKSLRFSIQTRVMRYTGEQWSRSYSAITFGLGVANWLAAYYNVPMKLMLSDELDGQWFFLTPSQLPLLATAERHPKPERRINL
jgi:hypothetical protein